MAENLEKLRKTYSNKGSIFYLKNSLTMRTTIPAIAWFDQISKDKLFNLMTIQSSATRSAYQAIQKGLTGNDIKIYVKKNFMSDLNQRFVSDACSLASQIKKPKVIFGGKFLWPEFNLMKPALKHHEREK